MPMPPNWHSHPTKLSPSEYRMLVVLQEILGEPTLNSTLRALIRERVAVERTRHAFMLRES